MWVAESLKTALIATAHAVIAMKRASVTIAINIAYSASEAPSSSPETNLRVFVYAFRTMEFRGVI